MVGPMTQKLQDPPRNFPHQDPSNESDQHRLLKEAVKVAENLSRNSILLDEEARTLIEKNLVDLYA